MEDRITAPLERNLPTENLVQDDGRYESGDSSADKKLSDRIYSHNQEDDISDLDYDAPHGRKTDSDAADDHSNQSTLSAQDISSDQIEKEDDHKIDSPTQESESIPDTINEISVPEPFLHINDTEFPSSDSIGASDILSSSEAIPVNDVGEVSFAEQFQSAVDDVKAFAKEYEASSLMTMDDIPEDTIESLAHIENAGIDLGIENVSVDVIQEAFEQYHSENPSSDSDLMESVKEDLIRDSDPDFYHIDTEYDLIDVDMPSEDPVDFDIEASDAFMSADPDLSPDDYTELSDAGISDFKNDLDTFDRVEESRVDAAEPDDDPADLEKLPATVPDTMDDPIDTNDDMFLPEDISLGMEAYDTDVESVDSDPSIM